MRTRGSGHRGGRLLGSIAGLSRLGARPATVTRLHIGVSVQCYKWVLCEDYVNVGEEHRDSNVEHLCENLEFERRGGVVVCPPTASLE